MSIRLSQTAPWNPRLRNSYRDRYTEVGGRYFKVSADSLESLWTVEEVDFDGETLWDTPDGAYDYRRDGDADLKFLKHAFRLSDARELIEQEVTT
jgi:hypothetical protein